MQCALSGFGGPRSVSSGRPQPCPFVSPAPPAEGVAVDGGPRGPRPAATPSCHAQTSVQAAAPWGVLVTASPPNI